MIEDCLVLIESRLGITLPESYRLLHNNPACGLEKLDRAGDAITPLYLTAEHVIAPNLEEREPKMGTACAFPNWWESFFLIGTNGGGDYYSLRLDNTEGVWLIGSDCGDVPLRVADTLQQHVEQTIADHEATKTMEAERVRQHAPFQAEINAHLAAIACEGSSTAAAEWMTCGAIWPMFQWLNGLAPKVSPRKLRLYGLALCRLIPDLENDADCAAGIALATAMTTGTPAESQVSQMRDRLRDKIQQLQSNYESLGPEQYRAALWRINAVYSMFQTDEAYLSNTVYPGEPDLTRVYSAVGYATTGWEYGVDLAPDLLREVLGNPFHQVPVAPPWRTADVVNLARTFFETDAFQRLPELGIALQNAGCQDDRVLMHCQRPNHHVRGCWVVDQILQY